MKKITNYSLSAILIVVSVFLFSCNQQKSKKQARINPEFGSFINAFTTGVISSHSSIKIRLQEEVLIQAEPDGAIENYLFKFSPTIEGKTYLIDKNNIEFKPKNPLKSGITYNVSFKLGKLVDVADDLQVFEFQFQTIKQSFSVIKEDFEAYSNKNLIMNKLSGYLSTSDEMAETEVKQILTAEQNGISLPVRWELGGYTHKYPFVIDSIKREEKKSHIILKWNGSKIGVDIAGADTIEIPALGDFKVMSITIIQHPEQHAVIQFSDPLKEEQVLNGIIRLDNGSDLKFTISNNIVKAYPVVRQAGAMTLFVETGVKNVMGHKMKEQYLTEVSFEEIKPAVRLIGKGVILPNSEGLIFSFEAVSLNAVDVRIIKIFENNIAQFLQVNQLDDNYQLQRVGRPVFKKKISLAGSAIDYGQWNAFSFDLTGLIKKDPGAIYQVELSFKKEYSLFNCPGEEETDTEMARLDDDWDSDQTEEQSYWDYSYSYYYYPDGYEWSEKDNPCHISYFNSRRWTKRNILASNVGIIAKEGNDRTMHFTVTDLLTTQPLLDVAIELYNYQQQLIATIRTSSDGMAEIELTEKPYLLIAKKGKDRGYLRLDDGSSLSISKFDVRGEKIQKGIKGYLYGERGVWRPGDTLFLTFILEDKDGLLPEKHPVAFELSNPHGQVVSRSVQVKGLNGFYSFIVSTDQDAPTGMWNAKVKVGGAEFNKRIRIETVKPNRLKINLDFGVDMLSFDDREIEGDLKVRWLHGAIARNLKANVTVTLNKAKTAFANYKDFQFDNPAKEFFPDEEIIFDGRVNDLGVATIKADLGTHTNAPGMLKANFMIRAYEESGAFSTDYFSIPYAPYKNFIGIKLPKGDKARGMLLTDTSHIAEIVTLDKDGNPVSLDNLNVTMYKVRWRWWWDATNENLASYVGSYQNEKILEKKITTKNGKGSFTFKVDYPDWGRYLICVEDPEGGHSTGQTLYIDWPGWAGRGQREHPGGASVLTISSDKKKYDVGEYATITIPTGGEGRALVSIENGSKVLSTHWVKPEKSETRFNFQVTKKMSPNIYVHVTLLQPHAQTINDLPIRLYGVIPVLVEDPETKLNPVIVMPDELAPEQKFRVTVSEKDNKSMTYTLAVVDEGLLDLTRFKTPDPWKSFYAREALGVKTWDMFDMVLGAYGGELERLFAIGGDEEIISKKDEKANRFKPVVMFLGPFDLQGGTATHTIMMPNYVGSVRTMVVAGEKGSYGSTEKATPVKNPLMILATLPRILGPGETVKLPVTVFAMDENIKDVHLTIEANDLFNVVGPAEKEIHFSQTGDKVVTFELEVKEKTGIGKVNIFAGSGHEKAQYNIELDIRTPNPPLTKVINNVIQPGETLKTDYTPVGMVGTNSGVLEVSDIPPIDFGRRLKYLIKYPYGCSEQITSSVFPQLYLENVMEIDAAMKTRLSSNIKAGIKRLFSMQHANGGIGYWPGVGNINDWSSSYAGHFMLEAEAKGYALPANFKNKWIKFQKKASREWKNLDKQNPGWRQGDLVQAYRLYTLALAGSPDMGAMNRMRETDNVAVIAKWRLAAAYALSGKEEVAKGLVRDLETTVANYSAMNQTFGSSLRDRAMILETMSLLKDYERGAPLAINISKKLSSSQWLSTQTTAYCLLSMAKFSGDSQSVSDDLAFDYKINDQQKLSAKTQLPVAQINFDIPGVDNGAVTVENKSEGIIYVRIILEGIPVAGNEVFAEENLHIKVAYTNLQGAGIDVAKIEQGTDFMAEVEIINPGTWGNYSEMALTQIFPSGWEIINTRLADVTSAHEEDIPDYKDIRDDRVYTHFKVNAHKNKKFVVLLNASYLGRFYLPAISCEAMYDNSIYARTPGKWVEVVIPGKK